MDFVEEKLVEAPSLVYCEAHKTNSLSCFLCEFEAECKGKTYHELMVRKTHCHFDKRMMGIINRLIITHLVDLYCHEIKHKINSRKDKKTSKWLSIHDLTLKIEGSIQANSVYMAIRHQLKKSGKFDFRLDETQASRNINKNSGRPNRLLFCPKVAPEGFSYSCFNKNLIIKLN